MLVRSKTTKLPCCSEGTRVPRWDTTREPWQSSGKGRRSIQLLQSTTLVGRTGCRDLLFNQNRAALLFRKEEGGLLDSTWTIQVEERGGKARGSTRSKRVLDDGDGRMLLRIVGSDNGGECLIVRLVDPHDGKVVRGVDGAPEMAVKVRNL